MNIDENACNQNCTNENLFPQDDNGAGLITALNDVEGQSGLLNLPKASSNSQDSGHSSEVSNTSKSSVNSMVSFKTKQKIDMKIYT